jgi:hypothetical protein
MPRQSNPRVDRRVGHSAADHLVDSTESETLEFPPRRAPKGTSSGARFAQELQLRLDLAHERVVEEATHLEQVAAVADEYTAGTRPKLWLMP